MRKQGFDPKLLLALLALVLVAGGVALLSVGGSSGSASKKSATTSKVGEPTFDAAGTLTPVKAAPPLTLHNYLGQPVNIASYRGKAVLVTFIYTHCPDVCPLITSNL